MHIIATHSKHIPDGSEPVDLNQNPASVVFLSTADTDLAILSQAVQNHHFEENFLRLGQLSWLTHPYSVDLFLEQTALQSKLVILRALGGLSYWQYCLEQFSVQLQDANKTIVILPGDDQPDLELLALSNISNRHWENLFGYLVEGGLTNAIHFLSYTQHILGQEPRPPLPIPELKNGIFIPGTTQPNLTHWQSKRNKEHPVAILVFYRALYLNGNIKPIKAMIKALKDRGITPLAIYLTSLKDSVSREYLEKIMTEAEPDIVLNFTSFALSTTSGTSDWKPTILDAINKPVLQVCLGSSNQEAWQENSWGLQSRDIAMSVSLPELDGRIFTRAIAFKEQSPINADTQYAVTLHEPVQDRIEFVADLTQNWIRLGRKSNHQKKIGLIFANYPNKDGRIANGVGLDTPQSAVNIIKVLKSHGYNIVNPPLSAQDLIALLQSGPTNNLDKLLQSEKRITLAASNYVKFWKSLPIVVQEAIESRWGNYQDDPFFVDDAFILTVHELGHLAIGIQPARGYNIDPKQTYHDPSLVPPHNYLAFYFWLRFEFKSDALIHLGKHGNLEWLPGKALALSENCFTDAILGPTPHFYPFIINDPGEGTQAKRRTQAVIIDHLTPPMTRAESYGVYHELEQLLDEYYEAHGLDRKRTKYLQSKITETLTQTQLAEDIGIKLNEDLDQKLTKLDSYLCDLKERQIRDGLHIFGQSPEGQQKRDLLASLVRIPRHEGKGFNASFLRSLAKDLNLLEGFDPLDCEPASQWIGKKPALLQSMSDSNWRTNGDTVERLELLFLNMLDQKTPPRHSTKDVWNYTINTLKPRVESCGRLEIASLIKGLNSEFVPPGPSGAPTRGRADILPTGRNFFSVDSRSLPTRTAWQLGWKSASLLIDKFVQDKGDWPRQLGLTAWGTSNMRTGGDDIAQALALMGVKPTWDDNSSRVTGFEILPLSLLGRPRVDVTLRVSGFFRDAFPFQVDLVSAAAKSIMQLDELPHDNPASEAYKRDLEILGEVRAGYRVFGSKPGAYGAGLQALLDEQLWDQRAQLGEAYLEWGSYPLGSESNGHQDVESFSRRLAITQAVLQNQDNHEHDILDSDDYYQFEGGMSAAIESLGGNVPIIYHNDHSRPERPVIRTLEDEIGRVVRARAANPKWLNGVKNHGYKGAFEIAATVDYLFAFAATTNAVKSHHFDITFASYIEDLSTLEFIKDNNPDALNEILNRYREALERNLWTPRSNSARNTLFELLEKTNDS